MKKTIAEIILFLMEKHGGQFYTDCGADFQEVGDEHYPSCFDSAGETCQRCHAEYSAWKKDRDFLFQIRGRFMVEAGVGVEDVQAGHLDPQAPDPEAGIFRTLEKTDYPKLVNEAGRLKDLDDLVNEEIRPFIEQMANFMYQIRHEVWDQDKSVTAGTFRSNANSILEKLGRKENNENKSAE